MKKLIFLGIVMVLLSLSFVTSESITSKLLGFYDFEESAGDLLDNSSNGNNGTVFGGITRGVGGIVGNGWDFNGFNTGVVLPDLSLASNKNFTYSLWANFSNSSASTGVLFGEGNSSSGTPLSVMQVKATNLKVNIQMRDDTSTSGQTDDAAVELNDSLFHHLVYTVNSTSIILYIDNVSVGSKAFPSGSVGVVTTTIGANNQSGAITTFFNGTLDYVAIYNRSLNATEVERLWNQGNGFSPLAPPNITLNDPVDGKTTTDVNITYNATINGTTELNNATLFIFNSSNGIFNETTIPLSGILNESIFQINSTPEGTYKWLVFACGNDSIPKCSFPDGGNFTITIGADFGGQGFNATALETASETYTINITVAGGNSVESGTLIYNGTLFSGASITDLGSDKFSLSKTIFVPTIPIATGSQLMNFTWNVTTTNDVSGVQTFQLSNESEQNVTELVFNLCNKAAGGTATESVLNFTLKDEFNGSIINAATNATTFQATFNIGADSGNLLKNFSINNQSVATSKFDFCTNNETNEFFLDMNAFYTAVDFSDSNHFLSNASIVGNVTSQIDLFLLRDADAVQFFITVENDLTPLEDAIVQVAKFFPGEGVFKTVEIDRTDSAGKFTAFLELDKEYKFTVIKDGVVLGIVEKTSICEEAPCELTIPVSTAGANIFAGFDNAFADNVLFNLSYNPFIRIVNFEFVDTTGLATSFTLEIQRSMSNQSAILISNQTIFTSSGSMSFNLSGQPDGDYMVRAYIQRSPNQLIAFLTIVLGDLAKELGLLGLFMTLIIVIATIFAVAITPKMMVLIVPLALTIPKLMGLSFLSPTTIVIIWILGGVAFVIMK